MNNYLHSLPFHKDAKNLTDCECLKQGFDPPAFKLYSEADRLPTFVLRLPPVGTTPDLTYANECIHIMTCAGVQIANITMSEAGVRLAKDSVGYFIVYDGRKITGINLPCGECYRLRIGDNYSEVFWVTATPNEKIRIEFSNKGQLGDVPYQSPINFVQKILVDGEICSMDAELFENRKNETNGKETISYQRLTKRKSLQIFNAPDFITQLISASAIHDGFSIFHHNEEVTPIKKRAKPTITQNGCCDYDIEVILPLRDIEIVGGNCQTDVDAVLTEVDIPSDLPDSCEIDDDFEPTDETLCLRKGEVPPPIDPVITPVGTPPPATCPPSGFVVSSITATADCSNPWIFQDVKYKKKITKHVADGSCGEMIQYDYAEPCTATHSLSNFQCTPPEVVLTGNLEILGGYRNWMGINGKYQPLVGRVKYNGVNVVNAITWNEPFLSWGLVNDHINNILYTIDNGVTWHTGVVPGPDTTGTNDFSNLWITNENPVNHFPFGSTRTVKLKTTLNNITVISNPITINVPSSIGS